MAKVNYKVHRETEADINRSPIGVIVGAEGPRKAQTGN